MTAASASPVRGGSHLSLAIVRGFLFLPASPARGYTDMKMPEKYPDLWAALLAWLSVHAPSVYAFCLSVIVAVVRVVYGGGTTRQMALEGAMCGLATLTLVPLLQYLGLPQSMATFAGGLVGFIGVEKLRDIAIRFGERKAGV